MDAIELVKKDHRKVEELFSRYQGGSGLTGLVNRVTGNVAPREKKTALEGICRELDVHAQIEEEILYPAIRKTGDAELNRQVDEALSEHGRVKQLVHALRDRTGDIGDDVDKMVSELKECVEHHVREEENEMLPRVQELVPDSERNDLGRRMQARKRTLGGATRKAASRRATPMRVRAKKRARPVARKTVTRKTGAAHKMKKRARGRRGR